MVKHKLDDILLKFDIKRSCVFGGEGAKQNECSHLSERKYFTSILLNTFVTSKT